MSVYFDEPTIIVAGNGFTFGPYGPGQCEATNRNRRCVHHTNHVGCHAANPTGDGKYEICWWEKSEVNVWFSATNQSK